MAVFATGQMSLALQQEILKRYLLNTTAITPVATVYVALATAIPTDAGFTEVTNANGYARVACPMSAVTAGPPSYITNSGIINFAAVTSSNWSAVTGWGIWDSGTYAGGNLLFYGSLTTTLAFSAVSVASPGVMTTATNGLTAGTTQIINILTNGATMKDASGATGSPTGPCQVDVVSTTSLALPWTCTVTGTGTIAVNTGSVQCNVGDVFQFAANAITIYLD